MDRTQQAVARQLAAMGATDYEVGVFWRAPSVHLIAARLAGEGEPLRHTQAEALAGAERRQGAATLPAAERLALAKSIAAKSNRMDLYAWTAKQVVDDVPWLDRQNRAGKEIYLRPAGHGGLVLADDITHDVLGHMRRNGLTPAVVLETSPANFQAWVRASQTPLSEEVTTAVARILAEQVDGDRGAAKRRQFGRLAGFANQKESRMYTTGPHAGLQPFVLLREATGASAPAGPALVRAAEERVREEARERVAFAAEQERALSRLAAARREGTGPREDVLSRAQSHFTRLGAEQDLSKLDYAVVCALTRDGYGREEIWTALAMTSPRLAERHPNTTYYLTRTLDVAMAAAARDLPLAGRR